MCSYCEGRKTIRTEVDDEAVIRVYENDPEYPYAFRLDIYESGNTREALVYSFEVPCCPMCGRCIGEEREHE